VAWIEKGDRNPISSTTLLYKPSRVSAEYCFKSFFNPLFSILPPSEEQEASLRSTAAKSHSSSFSFVAKEILKRPPTHAYNKAHTPRLSLLATHHTSIMRFSHPCASMSLSLSFLDTWVLFDSTRPNDAICVHTHSALGHCLSDGTSWLRHTHAHTHKNKQLLFANAGRFFRLLLPLGTFRQLTRDVNYCGCSHIDAHALLYYYLLQTITTTNNTS